jgi:hypothetical protein
MGAWARGGSGSWRRTKAQAHPIRISQAEDCRGAAEALGGVPRGSKSKEQDRTEAQTVSRSQGEAHQKSRQGASRESCQGEDCGGVGHNRQSRRFPLQDAYAGKALKKKPRRKNLWATDGFRAAGGMSAAEVARAV